MKSYFLIFISAMLLIQFSGCKKKSFDPTSKTQDNFIGTWKGSISTFKDNKLLKEYGTVVIYPNSATGFLQGIIFMKETNVFNEFQFVDGTMYFNVENTDPASPFCQNWSLGGYAVFTADGILDIRITGNECGQVGSEFINWVGTLEQTGAIADSVKYYDFAKSGNLWNYKVTLKNGDTCQLSKQIIQAGTNYLYSGTLNQNCGWTGQTLTFKWNVSPALFSVISDSTLSYKPFTLPINAKPGVVYSSYISSDTTTVTLLDTNLVINTPAGNFNCVRFRYTEPVNTGILKVTKTSYFWLNNRYGIVKQEVANPTDSTDVQNMVLISKGF
ncbi:MAG: hypothetical protein NT040_12810 [Bacteroidetes bacterium]|nr:hypothetical protein [Bacteroidota bacterium]